MKKRVSCPRPPSQREQVGSKNTVEAALGFPSAARNTQSCCIQRPAQSLTRSLLGVMDHRRRHAAATLPPQPPSCRHPANASPCPPPPTRSPPPQPSSSTQCPPPLHQPPFAHHHQSRHPPSRRFPPLPRHHPPKHHACLLPQVLLRAVDGIKRRAQQHILQARPRAPGAEVVDDAATGRQRQCREAVAQRVGRGGRGRGGGGRRGGGAARWTIRWWWGGGSGRGGGDTAPNAPCWWRRQRQRWRPPPRGGWTPPGEPRPDGEEGGFRKQGGGGSGKPWRQAHRTGRGHGRSEARSGTYAVARCKRSSNAPVDRATRRGHRFSCATASVLPRQIQSGRTHRQLHAVSVGVHFTIPSSVTTRPAHSPTCAHARGIERVGRYRRPTIVLPHVSLPRRGSQRGSRRAGCSRGRPRWPAPPRATTFSQTPRLPNTPSTLPLLVLARVPRACPSGTGRDPPRGDAAAVQPMALAKTPVECPDWATAARAGGGAAAARCAQAHPVSMNCARRWAVPWPPAPPTLG